MFCVKVFPKVWHIRQWYLSIVIFKRNHALESNKKTAEIICRQKNKARGFVKEGAFRISGSMGKKDKSR